MIVGRAITIGSERAGRHCQTACCSSKRLKRSVFLCGTSRVCVVSRLSMSNTLAESWLVTKYLININSSNAGALSCTLAWALSTKVISITDVNATQSVRDFPENWVTLCTSLMLILGRWKQFFAIFASMPTCLYEVAIRGQAQFASGRVLKLPHGAPIGSDWIH